VDRKKNLKIMLETIFWLLVFLIIYCYIGYPLILIILGFFFGKKVDKGEITPPLSLLIPVYNEEKIIQKKIENSLELDYPKEKLEIVVASESNDATNEVVKKYQNKKVKLFSFSERKGKQHTIYQVLPRCQGEIVVLTDANGIFEKDALKKLVRNFKDPRIGCVSGELKYNNPEKSGVGESEGIYWRYENFLKKTESKLFSLLGANGSIYAIKKELYRPLSEVRGDDFDLPIRVLEQGYGVVWEKEAVSKEDVYPEAVEELKRKVVIVGWHFRGALILLKESLIKKFQPFLIFQLISHKIFRWLIGFFLIFIFISNIFLLKNYCFLIFFLIQLLFYLLAFLGYLKDKRGAKVNKLVGLIYYFTMVNFAALVGVARGVLGRQGPTWEKVR